MAEADLLNIRTPLGDIALSGDVVRRITDLSTRQDTFALGDIVLTDESPAAINNAVQSITLLLHADLIRPAQKERLKANEASMARINQLLRTRGVALQLERAGVTACFLD